MEPVKIKSDVFSVPEHFFETLPQQILARIDEAEQQPTFEIRPAKKHRARTLTILSRYVAGVAALLMFFFVVTQSTNNEKSAASAESSTQQQIAAESHADKLYDYMLFSDQNIYDYVDSTN